MRVGYRRVSSVDQSLARQDLGDCERVFEEKLSGGSTDRPALQEMIAFVRSDDDVVIHSIDRLALNLMDLQSIIKELNDKGASVHFVLGLGSIMGTPSGKEQRVLMKRMKMLEM